MAGKTLNLDQLFYSAKPIKVIFDGKAYELCRPIDLTPEQLALFERLSKKMTTLGELEKEPGEYSNDDANFVEGVLDDIIKVISPDFPVESLPFMAKVYVITNYQDELANEDQEQSKKA